VKIKGWIPDRQEVIWINCNPQVGQEMRDMHPFLVLSPRAFNDKTSLVIGLPMTTAEYNASNPFAVDAGGVKKNLSDKSSYILCHQPKSFDWRGRDAKPHPHGQLDQIYFDQVLVILNQIIQLTSEK
jgi:mRNA interferase MazF